MTLLNKLITAMKFNLRGVGRVWSMAWRPDNQRLILVQLLAQLVFS